MPEWRELRGLLYRRRLKAVDLEVHRTIPDGKRTSWNLICYDRYDTIKLECRYEALRN